MKKLIILLGFIPIFCQAQTLTFACGFEEQYINGTQIDAHWTQNNSGTTATYSTSTVRSGAAAGRVSNTATSANLSWNQFVAGQTFVFRMYIRFATLPNTNVPIMASLNGSLYEGLWFNSSDNKIYPGYGSTSSPTFGSAGASVSTGNWYLIDMKIVATGNPHTIDIKVDGTALTQLTRATASANYTAFVLGNIGISATLDVFYDDFAVSTTSGDYPIGGGFVSLLIPISDGTHNVAGTNDFERTLTGTDILNSTTDAYLLVNDVPFEGAGLSTYIYCLAPPNATDYVEVVFGAGTGSSTPTTAPRGVEFLISFGEVSAGVNNIRIALNDNGTLDDIFNSDPSGTAQRANKFYTDPPSAASAWTTSGNGNINGIRMRVFSSDAAPDTYWGGVICEAEFAPLVARPHRINVISFLNNKNQNNETGNFNHRDLNLTGLQLKSQKRWSSKINLAFNAHVDPLHEVRF